MQALRFVGIASSFLPFGLVQSMSQLSLASVITLFGDEKKIVRGIGYAQFLAYMRRVAGCGRLPSFGMEALNGCNPREHAVAPTAPDREQQPWNGIRVR